MSADPTPLPPEELDRIYRTLIRPLLFGPAVSDSERAPTLVLLGGQAGAGKSRASARLVSEHDGPIGVLSGDDLRIFHPDYRHLVTSDPEHAGPALAEVTRTWVREAIQDALDNRHSLLLEGSFGDPDSTLATADRFRRAGFHVRIVAIASPRVLSLVTAASRYLRDLRADAPARFTRLSAHDRGYDGTTRLIDSLETTRPADRVTILSRNGHILYDHDRTKEATILPGMRQALDEGRHPASWGARSTMELLGELKQITTYAITSGHLSPEVRDLLTEAHALALDEVVPMLSIDADSPQARFIHQSVLEQSAALGRAVGVDLAPAATTPAQPTPDVGRLNR
jgi:hypothetical protein